MVIPESVILDAPHLTLLHWEERDFRQDFSAQTVEPMDRTSEKKLLHSDPFKWALLERGCLPLSAISET